MARAVLPRLRDVFFISIVTACMFLGPRMLNIDSDLGRHLTLGNFMLQSRAIPVQDVLSFTKYGASRAPYEWLSQITFAIGNRTLGLGGVVLITALGVATAFWIALADAMSRSHSPLLSLLVTTLAAAASSVHWLTRPHVLSFAFFAVWILALERLRKGRWIPIWVFPGMMLLWANVHGGFVFGFLAWAAYTVGWNLEAGNERAPESTVKPFLWAGTTSLVASAVTPASWHNWEAVLQNRSSYILSRTTETIPPSFTAPAFWPYVALVLLVLVGLVRTFRKAAPAHAVLLGLLGIASLAIARNIPFFAIAATPILSEWFGDKLSERPQWATLENAIWKIDGGTSVIIWPLLFVAVTVAWLSGKSSELPKITYEFNSNVFPVAAADWMEAHPLGGNMLNDLNWGGYLLYRLWPQERVFIDSQTDFYGEDLTRRYEQMIAGEAGGPALLDHYHIKRIVVRPSSGIAVKLAGDIDWKTVYLDQIAVVLEREGPP